MLPNEDHRQRIEFAVMEQGFLERLAFFWMHADMLHVRPSDHGGTPVVEFIASEKPLDVIEIDLDEVRQGWEELVGVYGLSE